MVAIRSESEIDLLREANRIVAEVLVTLSDMVRPGIATYGLHPSDEVNKSRVDLRPVMSLKSRIIHLKRVPPGLRSTLLLSTSSEGCRP